MLLVNQLSYLTHVESCRINHSSNHCEMAYISKGCCGVETIEVSDSISNHNHLQCAKVVSLSLISLVFGLKIG